MSETIKTSVLPSGLYLVSTPIGNLRDITLRAIDTLKDANLIICEDTRISGKLLHTYKIDTPMLPYNDHNAAKQRKTLRKKLADGQSIALISDAGTPLVSDPGYKLVRDCIDLGFPVTSIPGANAPLTAMQLAGLPSDKFTFIGFLPSKTVAREKELTLWKDVPSTLIVFETAPRLLSSLSSMHKVLGNRDAAVVRELTKRFEQTKHGTLEQLIKLYTETGQPKGEIVIVLGPPAAKIYTKEDLDKELVSALKDKSVKDAASLVAEKTGTPRKILYERALELGRE